MADQDLQINLKGDTSGFSGAFKAAFEGFKQGLKGVEADSKQAKEALSNAFGTLNIKPFADLQAEAVKVKEAFRVIADSAGTSNAEVSSAAKAMKERLAEISAEMKGNTSASEGLGNAFSSLKGHILGAVAAYAGFEALKGAFTNIVGEASEAEQQVLKLTAAFGGGAAAAEEAQEKLGSLGDEATRVGQDAQTLSDNYIKLAQASRGTAAAGETMETAFKAVNDIQGSLGLSAEKTGTLIDSLAKTFVKGSVNAKDLRTVLLEAGISMESFAKAAGVDLATFNDELKEGKISTEQLVQGLKQVADVDLAGQAGNFAKTWDGQITIVQNTIKDLFQAIGQSGVLDALKTELDGLIKKFQELAADGSLERFAEGLGSAISTLVTVIVGAIKFVDEWKAEFIALIAIGVAAWAIQTVGAIVALTVATEASTLAARGLALAIKSIPLVAVGFLFYELTTAAMNFFKGSDAGAKTAKTSVEQLKETLSKIKPLDGAKLFADIDKNLATTIQDIKKQYADVNNAAIAKDKEASASFSREMNARVLASGAANRRFIAQDQQLAQEEKALSKQKSDLEASFRAAELAAKKQSNQTEIGDAKTKTTALTQVEKTAADARTATNKAAIDNITNQEQALKQKKEQLKDDKVAIDRQYLAASTAIGQERAKALENLEFLIQENAKAQGRAIAQAEKDALTQRIQAITDAGNKVRAATDEASQSAINLLVIRYNKELELGRNATESNAEFNKRKANNEKEFHAQVLDIARTAHEKKVSLAEEEVKLSQKALNDMEAAYKSYVDNVKDLEDKKNGIVKSYAEEEFNARRRSMDQRTEYLALEGKIASNLTEMRDLQKKASNESGEEQKATLKQLDELEKATKSYSKERLSLGKDAADSSVSQKKALDDFIVTNKQLKDISVSTLEAQINVSKEAAKGYEGIGGKIDVATKALDAFKATLKTVQDEKINVDIKIDPNGVVQAVESIKAQVSQGATLPIKPEASEAYRIIGDLSRPRSTTLTIYVTKVQTNAEGGYISHFAEGGFARKAGYVSGAGTSTSDDIPSMLSNGEYVIKASAVNKWGRNFFDSLNNGSMPSIQGFAVGGLVGSTNSASNDTVNLNLNLGGKAFKLQGARDQAMGLASALQLLSRAA